MRSRLLVAIAAALLSVSCSENGSGVPVPSASQITAPVSSCEGGPAQPPQPLDFGNGTVLLDGDRGSVLLHVEIAQNEEQHQFGLMFRTELQEDEGMVFVFFEENSGGFYMKNTYLPLSIAYFDVDGKILKIVDMDPCETDSTLYDPGVPYMGALEVNQGSFARWGVKEGDVVNLVARPEE